MTRLLVDRSAVRQAVMTALGEANTVGRVGAPAAPTMRALIARGEALLETLDALMDGGVIRAAQAVAFEHAWDEACRRHRTLRSVPIVNPYATRGVRP